ncbi:hypothetical protein F5Y16DRAFT_368135 [Xylariaceae sp. FL0255]|nr:hypothetical protein F5Y16DRAFT_368135 [Xylariaceae sp. FL0255]
MPSDKQAEAKEKFMQGVEKTRAPADQPAPSSGAAKANADNPKTGQFISNLAKGDTASSNYVPGHFGGNGKG